MIGGYNVRRIQCLTDTMLDGCNVRRTQCQTDTMLDGHNVRRTQCQTDKMLDGCNVKQPCVWLTDRLSNSILNLYLHMRQTTSPHQTVCLAQARQCREVWRSSGCLRLSHELLLGTPNLGLSPDSSNLQLFSYSYCILLLLFSCLNSHRNKLLVYIPRSL